MSAGSLPCRAAPASGFTLIEVIGALLIFALGVLMVVQSSGALTTQMRYSARSSEIVVQVHARLDSLETLPFDSLTAGTWVDTMTVVGSGYRRTTTVSRVTAILAEVQVTMVPLASGGGPSYTATSYAAASW